jgi:hypothetical protein
VDTGQGASFASTDLFWKLPMARNPQIFVECWAYTGFGKFSGRAMTPFAIGQFLGLFIFTLGVAAIWLLIANAIPPLRQRPRVIYGIAIGFVVLLFSLSTDEPKANRLVGGLTCVAIVIWHMRRSARQRDGSISTSVADLTQTSPTGPEASHSYFLRHWRGELSLGVSFWVNTLLGAIVLIAIGMVLGEWVAQSQSNYSVAALWVTIWSCAIVVLVWQAVGVWRSAARHVTATGGGLRAGAAKIVVIISCLGFLGQFISSGIPAIQQSFDRAAWLNANGKWQFRVLNNGTEMEVSGGIGHGFAADLERFLDATPKLKLIHVNLGSGGLIAEAMEASKAIKARGLATYVSASCVSACTLVFMGGAERYVQQGAKLGFHAPSMPGFTQTDLTYQRDKQKAYMMTRGVSEGFATRAMQTPSTNMWFPTDDELISQGVATRITTGDQFAISGFGNHTVAREELARNLGQTRIYRAVQGRDPKLFDQLVDITYAAINDGQSMDDVRRKTLPLISKIYVASLPLSSRDALLRNARLMAAEYRALQSAPGRTCLDYASKGDAASATAAVQFLSAEIKHEELEAMADAIESRVDLLPVPKMEDVQPDIQAALQIAAEKIGNDIELIARLDDPSIDAKAGCRAAVALFDALVSLPPENAERVLRAMFAMR